MEKKDSEPVRWQDKVKLEMDLHFKTCKLCDTKKSEIGEGIRLHKLFDEQFEK